MNESPVARDPGDVFREKRWRTHQQFGRHSPWGFLRQGEGHLLYYLARDYYSGQGIIVDAGSFVGRSAWFLATGLRANPRLGARPARLIHCFDNFIVNDQTTTVSLRDSLGINLALGESTRFIFDRATQDVAEWLQVHEGDFHTYPWAPQPIELLFVDIAKLPSLNRRLVELMFPLLIPGVSIVVQQDYHHPWLPQIHLTMEYLHEYFEIVEPKIDDSAAFLLTRPIPADKVEAAANLRATLHFDDKLELMTRAVERMPPDSRRHVELARALLIGHDMGAGGGAAMLSALNEIDRKYADADNDPHWPIYRGQMRDALHELSEGVHLGWLLVGSGNIDDALKLAERFQPADANYQQALILQAHCLRMQGRRQEAASVLDVAEALTPTLPSVWIEKAWLNLEKNLPQDAIASARKALAAAGGDTHMEAFSLDVLSVALSLGGDHDEARRTGEEAMRRLPTHPVVLIHQALNLQRAKRIDDAHALARSVLKIDPQHAAAIEILNAPKA